MRTDLPTAELTHDIGGEGRAGTAYTVVLDAPDAAPLYRCPQADRDVVDDAVLAAGSARRVLRRLTMPQRADLLARAAELLEHDAAYLARIVCRETGKPVREAAAEVHSAARALRNFGHEAARDPSRVLAAHSDRVWGFELAEPLGVAALVTPWNLPLQLTAMKVGAAVAAGCPVVLKPSPAAASAVGHLVRVLRDAGLPPRAASVVHGDGLVARQLARHPGVDVVSLTGSSAAGRAVMAEAAQSPKPCILELGGKSANIVFDDADLPAAVAGLVAGFVRNQGAVCTAGSRILVHAPVYEEVKERLVAAVARVRVGDPYEDVDMGALRSWEHRELVGSRVVKAVEGGAALLTGGNDVDVPGRGGAYLSPALLADVQPGSDLWQEELFAPVALIASFEDEADALRLAGCSDYGLAAGLWSRDLGRLERMWRELEVGTVYVNSYHRIDGIPLAAGGRRASGYGSEGGAAGIDAFLARKSVHVPR